MQSILSDSLLRVCTRCGKEPAYRPPGGAWISWCRGCCNAKDRQTRAKRAAAGTCRLCRKPALASRTTCDLHWVAGRVAHARGIGRPPKGGRCTTADAQRWLAILEEQMVCPYIGTPIGPGNAELDHVIPRLRGDEFPDVDLLADSNLQWVSKLANRMKLDMTPDEFRAACRAVAST